MTFDLNFITVTMLDKCSFKIAQVQISIQAGQTQAVGLDLMQQVSVSAINVACLETWQTHWSQSQSPQSSSCITSCSLCDPDPVLLPHTEEIAASVKNLSM
jgi:hypothetical protein